MKSKFNKTKKPVPYWTGVKTISMIAKMNILKN